MLDEEQISKTANDQDDIINTANDLFDKNKLEIK